MTGSGRWRRHGNALVQDLQMRDFEEALRCMQRVAEAAVDYERRPDMCVSEYNRVRLTIANLHHAPPTQAELRLAAKVDAIVDEHHPKAVA
jgi:pterin-4a-carbinolamine dehydratase